MKMLLFENAKLLAEAVAVFGILLVFWRHPAMQIVYHNARLHRVAIAVASLFMVEATAQVTTRDQYKYPQKHEPFPFTRWAMFAGFTNSLESAVLYDWRGITAKGEHEALNPARLFVSPNVTTLFTKTHFLGDQIPSGGHAIEPAVSKALNAFAQGLLARHNQLHAADPVVCVELWKRPLPLQQGAVVPTAFAEPEGRLVYTYTPAKP